MSDPRTRQSRSKKLERDRNRKNTKARGRDVPYLKQSFHFSQKAKSPEELPVPDELLAKENDPPKYLLCNEFDNDIGEITPRFKRMIKRSTRTRFFYYFLKRPWHTYFLNSGLSIENSVIINDLLEGAKERASPKDPSDKSETNVAEFLRQRVSNIHLMAIVGAINKRNMLWIAPRILTPFYYQNPGEDPDFKILESYTGDSEHFVDLQVNRCWFLKNAELTGYFAKITRCIDPNATPMYNFSEFKSLDNELIRRARDSGIFKILNKR